MNPSIPESVLAQLVDGGLIAAIAQDADSKDVLMQAWMNREALELTLTTGRATYWSRSRQQLWIKGETSGHTQQVREAFYDCDGDSLLLLVDQVGAACHTGERTCFHSRFTSLASAESGNQNS